MTVPVIASNEIQYLEDGATLTFPVPFRFLEGSDLQVRRRTAGTADFIDVASWSAAGADNDNGGSVTLISSTAGATLSIRRETPIQQPTEFDPLQDFPAESTEISLDRLAMAMQDLENGLGEIDNRAIKLPEGEVANELAPQWERTGGGKILSFDPTTGQPVVSDGSLFKGDPGGDLTATGPMSALYQQRFGPGVTVIRTTGFYADGDGGDAFNKLMPPGTMGGVGATADNKVAIPLPSAGVHNALAWGLRADATTIGGSPGCTDNLPLLQKLLTYGQTAITGVYNSGPYVRFPGSNGYYYFSDTLKLRQAVIFEGDGYGMQSYPQAQASKLTWPSGKVGIQLERYDTDGNNGPIAPTLTGSDGSILRGLAILGGGYTGIAGAQPADVVTNLGTPTYHGIWSKVRFTLEKCLIAFWTGHGVYVDAAGTGTGALRGNANENYWSSVTVQNVGGWGFWIQGADGNASSSRGLGTDACGLGGLADLSFLGNTHVGFHNDGCGTLLIGRCAYNNVLYDLISATPGIGNATTPGTNLAVWYPVGTPTIYKSLAAANKGNGTFGTVTQGAAPDNGGGQLSIVATGANSFNITDYTSKAVLGAGVTGTAYTYYGLTFTINGTALVAGDTFTIGIGNYGWNANGATYPATGLANVSWTASNAILSTGLNARSAFLGAYNEGGSPAMHVQGPAMLMQFQGLATYSSTAIFPGGNAGAPTASYLGYGAFQYLQAGDVRGTYTQSYLTISGISWLSQALGAIYQNYLPFTNIFGTTGLQLAFSNTTSAGPGPQIFYGYARSGLTVVESPGTFWPSGGLLIGASAIRADSGTAPPTTGQSKQGDIRYNSAATATGVPGWTCTTTGINGSTSVWTAWPVL